jgi:hypothetical protein
MSDDLQRLDVTSEVEAHVLVHEEEGSRAAAVVLVVRHDADGRVGGSLDRRSGAEGGEAEDDPGSSAHFCLG